MENRVITGVIGVFVVICLVGAALVPLIDSWAKGESEKNEGAGWLRMDYQEVTNAESAFTIQGAYTDDGLQVSNYTASTPDIQTGADDTIIYASSNVTAWTQDGTIMVMGMDRYGDMFLYEPEDYFQIDKAPNYDPTLLIDDAVNPILLSSPTWAYIPKSSGSYGFFADGTPVKTLEDKPLVAVGGGFAGVYAFNDVTRYAGLGLHMVPEYDEEENLVGVSWQKGSAALTQTEPFDPSSITISPLDPSVLDPSIILDPGSGSAQIMSVPTPTYVDGEWGYKLETVDNVQKAVIQSYSGSGGNIVVPSTVGGYDVYRFGNLEPSINSIASQVIDNTAISANSTLTLPSGLVQIGNGALKDVTNITGTLTIPDGVTTIGNGAFQGCTGFTGTLTIPDSVTNIYANAFYQCSGFTGTLTIPDSMTSVEGSTFGYCTGLTGLELPSTITTLSGFYGCSGLTGTLTVPDGVTTIGQSAFRECSGLTGLVLPDGIEKVDKQAFYNCTSMTGPIVLPDSLTYIGQECFYNTKFTGTLIIPGSVAYIGNTSFAQNLFENVVICEGAGSDRLGSFISYASNLKNVVIATDLTPSATNLISNSSGITEVLDLSDTVDYSVNRYGMPATATYSDSIGETFGYISFVEISSDPILSDGAAALMLAIPIVIFGALIAVGAAIFIRRY